MSIKNILFLAACIVALLLLNSCFMGSSILFLESDAEGKPNLILNPEFDTDPQSSQSMPQGWMLMGSSRNNEASICCDRAVFLAGTQSLRIKNSRKHLMIISDAFRINGQSGYYIKASAKSTNLRGSKIKLHFIAYNAAGNIRNTFKSSLWTTDNWKKTTISAGFLKKDVNFGRVLIIVPPTEDETIWIDDLGCFQVHHFGIN